MSPDLEGPLPWRRHRFQLPKRINRPWSNLSPVFRFEDVEWYLQCEQTSCGTIRLWLHSSSEQPPSFTVSVRVESSDGAEPYSNELLDVVDDWTSWPPAIWMRQARELELLLPEFQWDRFLTFWIAIKKKDLRRSLNSAGHFPRPRPQPETFADASVQTISTAAAFDPCLNSLSEDIGKLLDHCSNPDVVLHCAGHTAGSHKNVLSVRSPLLARMIQQNSGVCGGRTNVDIRDMNADTFRLFVKYLHTDSVEQECLAKNLYVNLSSGDVTSAALLRATDRTSYSRALDCTITIHAPDDHYITAAVREIGFRMKPDGRCIDYLRIKDDAMCKPMRHLDEEHHFDSKGNTMQLLYHVAPAGEIDNSTVMKYSGFQVTVTAYRRGCPSDDAGESDELYHCNNGYCIWSGLRCDYHNNCGDLSDEENCSGGGSGSTALIVLGVLIVLLMVIMCVATLICSKNENIRRIRTRTMSYLRRFSK